MNMMSMKIYHPFCRENGANHLPLTIVFHKVCLAQLYEKVFRLIFALQKCKARYNIKKAVAACAATAFGCEIYIVFT